MKYALFFFGMLSVQRFILPDVYHLAMLFPAGLALVSMMRSPVQASVYVILMLYFTADLGGGIYTTTPGPLRWLGYLIGLANLVLLTRFVIKPDKLILVYFVITMLSITTLVYSLDGQNIWQTSIIVRDIFILICIVICLFDVHSENETNITLAPLYWGTLGALCGEFINSQFFHSGFTSGYMSMASLKAFVVFPIFYRIIVGKGFTLLTALLVIAALTILMSFNSKMTLLSLMASLFLIPLAQVRHDPLRMVITLGLSIFACFVGVSLLVNFGSEGSRLFTFAASLVQGGPSGFLDFLATAEEVRYNQHVMFASRSWFEIFFGSGIGAGIHDTGGIFSQSFNKTAFSDQELNSGVFFGFHDIWIDFSLRYGIIVFAIIMAAIIGLVSQIPTRIIGVVLFIMIINAAFSNAGLLLIALMYKAIAKNWSQFEELSAFNQESQTEPDKEIVPVELQARNQNAASATS